MRSLALSVLALPVIMAHTSPLERRSQRAHAERRQLLGGLSGDDEDSSLSDLILQSSLTFGQLTPSTRSSSTAAVTSAITTTPRVTSSSLTTSPVSVIGTSAVSTGSVSATGSGSVSGTASISRASGSVNGSSTSSGSSTISSSASITSSASASSSASQILKTSIDGGGNVVVVTEYYTPSSTSVSTASAAASSTSTTKDDSPAIGTGAIVGISVAVGVVILGLIGCAIWRMKRRSGDEDDAIRWPELNRHGDSSAHHALPARATGKHGIETDALERTMSNSSEMYMTQTHGRPPSMPMALNGSNFGAASALDNYDYAEKEDTPNPSPPVNHASAYDYGYPSYHPDDVPGQAGVAGYDHHHHEDYSNMPPPVGIQPAPLVGTAMYESDSDGDHHGASGRAGGMGPPTYRS